MTMHMYDQMLGRTAEDQQHETKSWTYKILVTSLHLDHDLRIRKEDIDWRHYSSPKSVHVHLVGL